MDKVKDGFLFCLKDKIESFGASLKSLILGNRFRNAKTVCLS